MLYKYIIEHVPDEIARYIHEFVDPETTWVQTQIEKLNVNDSGWIIGRNKTSPRNTIKDRHAFLNIIQAMKEIPCLVVPAVSATRGSYGLKHVLERFRGKYSNGNNYISNGEFICAMILLGFKYKTPDCLNLEFKVKKNKSVPFVF